MMTSRPGVIIDGVADVSSLWVPPGSGRNVARDELGTVSAARLGHTGSADRKCYWPLMLILRPNTLLGGALVSSSRCAANEAPGTVTYLTGFAWDASVGILDPVAARAQGFYRAMCLTVQLRPGNGDRSTSGQLVAAGE
jgi:hypothetical protein